MAWRIALSLPMTSEEFTADKQTAFRVTLAKVAGVLSKDVSIDIYTRRHLLPRICVEASITVTDEAENAADMDGCILSAVMTADRINKELFTADLPAVIVLLPRINIFEKGEDFLLPSCIVKEGKIVMNSGLTTFLRLDVRSLVHVLSTCKCLRGQWRQTLLSPEETFARLRIIEKRPQQMNMLDACKRDLDAVPSHLKEWLTAVVVDVVGDPEHHSLTPYFDVIVTEVDVCKQHAKLLTL